jgi:ADP-ribose pyrophosphatase YjhB (NUDIX family)
MVTSRFPPSLPGVKLESRRVGTEDFALNQIDIAIAALIHDGRVLICLTHDDGSWKFPSGPPQADESLEHALPRLLADTAGLEIEIDQPLMPYSGEHSDTKTEVHPFLCRCTAEPPPLDDAHFKWINAEELADYAMDPQSEPLIPWLEDHLTAATEDVRRQSELDALRIRQVAKARQAAMRAGSYCLIFALACAVAAIDLLWRAVRRYALEQTLTRPALYLLAAIPLAWFCWRFTDKAINLRREAQRRSLPEPVLPPDFSGLSDGSHVVRNLERMQ